MIITTLIIIIMQRDDWWLDNGADNEQHTCSRNVIVIINDTNDAGIIYSILSEEDTLRY